MVSSKVLRKHTELANSVVQRSCFGLGLSFNLILELFLAGTVLSTAIDLNVITSEPSITSLPTKFLAHSLESGVNENHSLDLWQQLNLSPQQKRQIKQISLRYQQQINQLRKDLSLAQKQLAKMMIGQETVETIRFKHQYVSLLRQQLATLHFESMLATREVLSLQQRQKFADIIQADR